jgi:predicted lipid carrier protein YhbT
MRAGANLQEGVLMRLRPPVEFGLTRALRRVARRRPDAFERLGRHCESAFVIAPDELPVCFRIEPRASRGSVQVVRRSDPRGATARISGPLATLLRLFDGSSDADASFFSRRIAVEGDTDAVVALHNSLEAAELDVADLAGPFAPGLRLVAGAAAAPARRRRAGA